MEEKVVYKRPPKSPALAGILSIFIPGTGALYNGQLFKGLIFMIIIPGLISLLAQGPELFIILFASLLLAGFYIYQIIDAVHTAKSINRRALLGEDVEEVEIEEFPQAVKSGSVFWGAFLMGLGGILLLANFEVISYGTIFDLWPIAVIAIGIKLISDYFIKNKEPNLGGKNGSI